MPETKDSLQSIAELHGIIEKECKEKGVTFNLHNKNNITHLLGLYKAATLFSMVDHPSEWVDFLMRTFSRAWGISDNDYIEGNETGPVNPHETITLNKKEFDNDFFSLSLLMQFVVGTIDRVDTIKHFSEQSELPLTKLDHHG